MADVSAPEQTGPNSASGRIKVANKDFDEETGTFSIAFSDGSSSEVNLSQFKPEIVQMLAGHGLSQKLGDSYASVKGDVAEAKKRYEAVLTQLLNGEWKKAREGEGGSNVTELAEAIALLKKVDVSVAMAAVSKATDDQKKAWRSHEKIKLHIAQIRARKAEERLRAAEKKAAEGGEAIQELAGLDLS